MSKWNHIAAAMARYCVREREVHIEKADGATRDIAVTIKTRELVRPRQLLSLSAAGAGEGVVVVAGTSRAGPSPPAWGPDDIGGIAGAAAVRDGEAPAELPEAAVVGDADGVTEAVVWDSEGVTGAPAAAVVAMLLATVLDAVAATELDAAAVELLRAAEVVTSSVLSTPEGGNLPGTMPLRSAVVRAAPVVLSSGRVVLGIADALDVDADGHGGYGSSDPLSVQKRHSQFQPSARQPTPPCSSKQAGSHVYWVVGSTVKLHAPRLPAADPVAALLFRPMQEPCGGVGNGVNGAGFRCPLRGSRPSGGRWRASVVEPRPTVVALTSPAVVVAGASGSSADVLGKPGAPVGSAGPPAEVDAPAEVAPPAAAPVVNPPLLMLVVAPAVAAAVVPAAAPLLVAPAAALVAAPAAALVAAPAAGVVDAVLMSAAAPAGAGAPCEVLTRPGLAAEEVDRNDVVCSVRFGAVQFRNTSLLFRSRKGEPSIGPQPSRAKAMKSRAVEASASRRADAGLLISSQR